MLAAKKYYAIKRREAYPMRDMRKKESSIPLAKFIKELQKEVEFHQKESTSYRYSSALLSLEVANKTKDVSLFLSRKRSKEIVSEVFPQLDSEKVEDVAKMLNVIAKELQSHATLPKEISRFLKEKRQYRKPLSFVKETKPEKEEN